MLNSNVIVVSLGIAAAASAQSVLDQHFDPVTWPNSATGGRYLSGDAEDGEGQSFTIGFSGTLDQIDLTVGGADNPVGFVLYEGSGYSGMQVGVATILEGDLGSGTTFATIFSNMNIDVCAGDVFTIRVFPGFSGVLWYQAWSTGADPYAGGEGLDDHGNPNPLQFIDGGIRTWVSPGECMDCPGDATGDGTVNFADLNTILEHWGTDDADGDVNNDGVVNFDDLNLLLNEWGSVCT